MGGSDEGVAVTASGSYSGTITSNDYVNLEIRRALPAAAVVVNENGVFELGFRGINVSHSLSFGEVTINAGGTLEVGHETDETRTPQELHVTTAGGRSGDLTLDSASMTVLQISGTGVNDFDRILVDGTANLDGTLQVLINPTLPSQAEGQITEGPYAPTLGDTFDIIRASTGLSADFDELNGVDGDDLAIWEASFATDLEADTDEDGDSDGTDFLAWQRQLGTAGTPGVLIDNSLVLDVVDPDNVLANAGFEFQLNVTSTLIQLEVVASAGLTAVPEPSSCLLFACGLIALSVSRRGRA